jgi:hypothetical protein
MDQENRDQAVMYSIANVAEAAALVGDSEKASA